MNACYQHLLDKIRMAKKQAMQPRLQYIFGQTVCDAAGFYKQYWNMNFFEIITELIQNQTNLADNLTVAALKLKYLGHPDAALRLLAHVADLGGDSQYSRYLTSDLLRELKRYAEAREHCCKLQQDFPDFEDVESCLAMCDVDELFDSQYDYYQILNYAHMLVKPACYIEIGVASGKSLALTRSGTCSIGVDPMLAGTEGLWFRSPEAEPLLFTMTSNDFFSTLNLSNLLGLPAFDMAFIDGDHTFEQALKDFIQLERLAGPASVIFVHDCLPVNPAVAEKQRSTKFWCGDVWKVLPCLKTIRPDLNIITFPAKPTGLAMVTGLNPASRILEQQFDVIVNRFSCLSLPESYSERCFLLNVANKDAITILEERLLPNLGRCI